MRNEGWTLGDLSGELLDRGLSLNDIDYDNLLKVINLETVEEVAKKLEQKYFE